MGQALVLRSPATLTDPGDAPVLPAAPDFTTGLLWKHVADAMAGTHADGDAITSWPASSGSRAAEATFAQHSTTVSRHVKYKANAINGHASALFDATNTQSLVTPAFSGEAVVLPYTDYVVGKATTEGVFVTGSGTSYLGLRRFTFGRAAAGAGSSTAELASIGNTDAPGALFDNGWHIIVAVFNGADSFIQIDSGAPVPGPLGVAAPANARLTQMRMGTNPGATGTWLSGEISEVGGYDRALTRDDVNALVASLRTKYAL